jgi:hypothetical protein
MLHHLKKVICSVVSLCVLFTVISGSVSVSAAESTTTNLPAGILIGDQDGIHVDAHGYYYIDARGLKPGDVITKTVTLQNLEHNDRTPEGKVPYTLSMTAEPLFSRGPVDLLDATHLTIKLDGRIIYDGTCRGNGNPNMIEKALPLGDYAVGDRRQLDFTLTVDPNMQLFEEKSEADFRWHFYAYRSIETDPPKTGVTAFFEQYGMLIPVALLLSFFALLIPLKKKRDEKARLAASSENSV